MAATVRLAQSGDLETLMKLRLDYFSAEGISMSAADRQTIESQLRAYFEKHLNNDFFAALVEIEPGVASVAFLVVSERPANLSWKTGKTGMILNVLTCPEHRRKGYATLAINALIRIARRLNLSYLELSASESGLPLYQQLGFKELDASDSHFKPMKLVLV